MSDRLEDLYKWLHEHGAVTFNQKTRGLETAQIRIDRLQSYIDTEITKGLIKNPSKLRIGMLRQALNEDRITDPKKMIDNEYIEHWLGIKALNHRKDDYGASE